MPISHLQWEFYKALFGGTCPGHPFNQSILNLLLRPYTGIWFLSQLISLWHLCDIIYFLLWSQPCFIVHFIYVICCMYVLWYSLYAQSRHFMYLFSNSGGWNEYHYITMQAILCLHHVWLHSPGENGGINRIELFEVNYSWKTIIWNAWMQRWKIWRW